MGVRTQARRLPNVRLYSRRGADFTKPFAAIAAAVSKIKAPSFILDGEAVAIDPQGKPSFQMLQTAQHSRAVGTSSFTASICST